MSTKGFFGGGYKPADSARVLGLIAVDEGCFGVIEFSGGVVLMGWDGKRV